MKDLQLNYQHSLINERHINEFSQILIPEFKEISNSLKFKYETEFAPLYLPSDIDTVNKVKAAASKIKADMLILIGIGGSNLGTMAIFQALAGKFYNEKQSSVKLYCIDTIDDRLMHDILNIAESELKQNKNVILVVVSKSGLTTETLVNSAIFIELLKKYKSANHNEHVVIITDNGSPLCNIAKKNNYVLLEIPKKVGGRYSVFSAVGLFPLQLLNINVDELINGAAAMRDICLSTDISKNVALQSAAILFAHYKSGKNINDLFIFDPALEMLGNWYRQLVGESLGKKEDRQKKCVEIGLTPTVSIGTTDLHSVGQLYLGGPRDKITTFVYDNGSKESYKVPINEFSEPLKYIENKTISDIKESIYKGVQNAYINEKRPFMAISFASINPFSLGEFIMMKMCEIIYLGFLLNIDPFDQPAVELYKSQTRRLLEHE